MPSRKPGTLLPLEIEILRVALSILRSGQVDLYGFGLAVRMRAERDARSLTAHGTLYKALGRLEELGLLSSHWEDDAAATPGRPRRHLYQLTGEGARLAEETRATTTIGRSRRVAGEPA